MSRLRLPIQKPFLHWWIECEEKDPHSALPTLYYTANVELREDCTAWCDENLGMTPTFETERFDICEDCFTYPQIESRVPHVYLIFPDDAAATLFALRWC